MEQIEAPIAANTVDTRKLKLQRAGRIAAIVVVVLLILAAIGAVIYGLVSNPPVTAVLRDIFIILLAVVTIVIGLFLVVLIFQLQSLIALLRDEIRPMLESANETASTVRGTTSFVSDAVVTPMIQVASLVAAARGTVKAALGTETKRAPRRTPTQGDQ